MGMKVNVFTKSKPGRRNEVFYGFNEHTVIIVDGATDKSGRTYDGKTGGEIVSHLVVEKCLESKLNGTDLINFLNQEINELYSELGIIDDIKDPKNRFTGGLIVVRIVGKKIIITYLGDCGFRINGENVYQEIKQVDIDNAEERARFIKETGDIEGSRDHIIPLLIKQFDYQNNSTHVLGYGAIDGTKTPEKFVKVFEYDKDQINTLEFFTDGYFGCPEGCTIEDWEKIYARIEEEDPHKCLKYKSTKSGDDRTVLMINFEN